jgi:beta-N-acetylhexosaminidase
VAVALLLLATLPAGCAPPGRDRPGPDPATAARSAHAGAPVAATAALPAHELNPRPLPAPGDGGPPPAACVLPPLRTRLAQLLLVGFPGTVAGPASRRLVDQGVGGLLLFRRNVASAAQVRRLLRDLRGRAAIPLEVAVDQEPGWRVARLAGIVRAAPAARQLGRMPPDRIHRYGQALGRDLARLGVTADLAPVLDVTGSRWDGVIGDRAFGADPATVSRAAVAFMRGLADGGVATVGKHFPGHGATTVDSHRRLPVVHGTRAHLAAWELVPFRAAIRTGLDGVMVGHLVVSAVDARTPATLSWAVIGGLLRGRLAFDGLVVSDALEMGAIAGSWPLPVAAERALAAGVDQLLLSDHTRVTAVLDRLQQAVAAGRLSHARVREAFLHVQRFKRVDRWASCA